MFLRIDPKIAKDPIGFGKDENWDVKKTLSGKALTNHLIKKCCSLPISKKNKYYKNKNFSNAKFRGTRFTEF